MRAALIDHYRGLPRVAEVSKPQGDSGQSLVAVRAAALQVFARGARVVNFGSAAAPTVDLPSALLRFQGIVLVGHNSMLPPREIIADTYRRLIECAARGDVTIAREEIPLEQIAEAWQRQQTSPHTKLVIVL